MKTKTTVTNHCSGQTYVRMREPGRDQNNRPLPVPRLEPTFHTVGGASYAHVRYIEDGHETIVRLRLADWDKLDKSLPADRLWKEARTWHTEMPPAAYHVHPEGE